MSHGRKPILQLDDRSTSSPLRNKGPVADDEDDDDDDDSMGDMPTPERLVEQDLPTFGQQLHPSQPRDIDDKVANFLAEIDALNPGDESSNSPQPPKIPVEREEESPPHFTTQSATPLFTQSATPPRREISPPPPRSKRREISPPPRSKPGAYSNMFVKGTPEFVKKKEEKRSNLDGKIQLEPWPEEPKTEWQQLMDEKTNYPYYWHMNTNDVVWDMPPEFSKYLILKKEYEEKVEKGLKDGTLDPSKRLEKDKPKEKPAVSSPKPKEVVPDVKHESSSHDKKRRPSHSEDSSSDSSDSEDERRRKSKSDSNRGEPSLTTKHKDSDKERGSSKEKKRESPDVVDSTEPKKVSPPPKVESRADESMDFDIDDIDKELEMALERKRQELMSKEENKKEKERDPEKERSKDKDKRRKDDDRKSDRHRDRHRDDDRRKHSKHKDRDRDRDRDRNRDRDKDRDKERDKDKKHKEIDEIDIPKLTLKERLKMEMELKLEKERKKKKALIEEMMAKELEKTVASGFTRSSLKRGRDDFDRDEPRKRYRDDNEGHRHGNRDQDDFRDYKRGMYDSWDRRGPYDDEYSAPPLKPPPPTAEMLAYEEERRSEVVDYAHGRSRKYDQNGDSDPEDTRPADIRDIEMKKLEALQLAELALSKLEFLEVSKKGLSKLQILLIELETRHLDWQAGGLTTNHFLTKLRETNRQLEQYEASAAPAGWACSWDRDYRRYYYTHKLTGKTQWDYPDADDIKAEDAKAKESKEKPKMEPEPGITSTDDRLQGYNVEKDLTEEILASVSLPPPPPPPAEEHPSVKSLMLMYGSSSDSEPEETNKKQEKIEKEEQLPDPPPLPPPPLPKEEKPEKERKHKSKKKKKEKSKKKDQEQASVGPVYPTTVAMGPEGYSEGMMTYDPSQPEGTVYTDPQALEAWYAAQGQTGEIPVYGQVGGPDSYTQNDQPLEFGTVPDNGGYPAAGDGGEQGYHPPETYKAVPTVYSEPNGAGDFNQSTSTETNDGLNIEIGGTLIPPNTEEKKKKKKEKMGSSNISLKKKHVSSMVQKWQKVKKEVELEERDREIREAEIRRKLAELD